MAREIKLKYLCTSFSTSITQQDVFETGDYSVYGASGFVGYLNIFNCDSPYLGIIKDGAGVGRINKYKEKTSLLGTMAYIIPNNGVNIDWLKYVIEALDLGKDIGKTTIPHIYFSNYGNRKVYFVDLEQQNKIASFLDQKCAEIDAVIEKTRATIEEYKKLKQSVITEAVTKGIRGNRPMKDSGIEWIGDIPVGWEIVRIGTQYTERKKKVSDTEYPPLSVTMKGIVPQLATAAKTDAHDDRKLVCIGDFAINSRSDRRGSCGISAYNGSVSLINTILCPRDKMNPNYYGWLFRSTMFSDEFYKWGHGIVNDLWTTNWQDMKRIFIPEPSLVEQQKIASFLDQKCAEIDTLIAKKTTLLTELETYKKSLIYEYVTGKKEVGAVSDNTTITIVYPYFPAILSTDKTRFAQAVLMSKILDSNVKYMGRVKLEKMLFTIEHSLGFDFDTEYAREMAGPLDSSIYECEKIISRTNKWFYVNNSHYGTSYKPQKNIGKYKRYYEQYFSDYNEEIESIISVFKNYSLDQSEIIATLFAAWNDAIIDTKQFTDEDIVNDVLNNWHESKTRFPKDVWLRAMKEMRKNNLIPKGYGKKTVIKND